ncbi:putative olfactory receptor 14L1 [Tachyglossus aculeatus]|uniref:putative olfactory receptor 14L1 n=1 Tax=Tachyglossus aculeatus TaxID=9261 RepID=UPI0018F2DF15|nr:putative olfactory receptor 14L1 [Tachyglossus aculeatus]
MTEFHVLGYSEVWELTLVHALLGNLLIVTVTALDRCLHTPMYFFLRHLSIFDYCRISVTVPKSISNSMISSRSISSAGCRLQVLFFTLCGCSEVGILTAIGQLMGILHFSNIFFLPFCVPVVIRYFFCDVPQVLKLIRPGDTSGEMSSTEGRAKAFSTFLPHLVVIILFLSSGEFEYLNPVPDSPSLADFLLLMFYAVVTPTLNPVIYSLRNRDIKTALGMTTDKMLEDDPSVWKALNELLGMSRQRVRVS